MNKLETNIPTRKYAVEVKIPGHEADYFIDTCPERSELTLITDRENKVGVSYHFGPDEIIANHFSALNPNTKTVIIRNSTDSFWALQNLFQTVLDQVPEWEKFPIGKFDEYIQEVGSKFRTFTGDTDYDDIYDAEEAVRKFYEKPMEFGAPRFIVKRGSELGYHCHAYVTIGNKDAGIMTTLMGEHVFAERHRVGKVKKAVPIDSIGEHEKADLAYATGQELSKFSEEERRKPSEHATRIGTYGMQF